MIINWEDIDFDKFKELGNVKFNSKYSYEPFLLIKRGKHQDITILCPIHGIFNTTPFRHLEKTKVGCSKCVHDSYRLTQKEWEERSSIAHSNKYSYQSVCYVNEKTKVEIICPEHGKFTQQPNMHVRGQGCPRCQKNYKSSLTEFIVKAKLKFGDFYGYSKVVYKDVDTQVIIDCPNHGEFLQTPYCHLNKRSTQLCCPRGKGGHKKTTEDVIMGFREVHGEKYLYDKVIYAGCDSKLTITCPVHGDFEQTPNDHFSGYGCNKCGNVKDKKYTNASFGGDSSIVHNNKYSYVKSIYTGCDSKLTITCPVHGDFKQRPSSHLRGHGCSKCLNPISKEHLKIINFLKNLGYKEDTDFLVNTKKFLINPSTNYPLELDIYFPKIQLAIEVDGVLYHGNHKNSVKVLGSKRVAKVVIRDLIKNQLCLEQNITLLRFTDIEINKQFDFVSSSIIPHISS